jgi:heat-inducible transcriptional repressor
MARAERGTLGERKAAVLRAIIEEHVRTGEPVGSETVAEQYGLNVSPATIRNEMAALEEMGYLSHPHTSAGRTPTHLGYRHFVDALPHRSSLREPQRRAITQFFEQTARDLEEVLVGATRLLSHLTQYAGLAVPPSSAEDHIVRAEIIELGSSLLLLAVGHHGRVYKAALDRPEDVTSVTARRVNERLTGVSDLTLSGAAERLRAVAAESAPDERALLTAAADALAALAHRGESEDVVVEGVGTLAVEVATWRRDTVRRLFDALEGESEILRLLLDVAPSADLSVTIGEEHPATGLWDAAVVAAPYRVGDTPLGTIGVVGPTRMDYLLTMSAVRAVARRLTDLATALENPPG